MKTLLVREIVAWLNGLLVQGSETLTIANATVHPGEIRNNTLYFHFPGTGDIDWTSTRFKDAIVVTQDPQQVGNGATIVKVNRVKEAYWSFIRHYRGLFDIPVIGVTGTCGKTTTTEMIRHILSKKMKVQSTDTGKNSIAFNLPYLLGIDEATGAAVFEMGVAKPGNIRTSARYFRPRVGVLLNIGVYHLQGCGTLENYIRAKAEMVEALPPQGTLILNADDENIKAIDLSRFEGRIVRFGLGEASHYRAKDARYARGGMRFTLQRGKETYHVFVPGYGEHNVYNALAAIAASRFAGINLQDACERLASFRPVSQHLQFRIGRNGSTIIDDTWNCTPPSVHAALEVIKATANGRRTVAVLGYMPRLGDTVLDEYDKIGKKAVETGVDCLIVIGEAERIGRKAIELGMDKQKVVFCETAEEVFQALAPLLDKHTLILLKFPYKYRYRKLLAFRKLLARLLPYRR